MLARPAYVKTPNISHGEYLCSYNQKSSISLFSFVTNYSVWQLDAAVSEEGKQSSTVHLYGLALHSNATQSENDIPRSIL